MIIFMVVMVAKTILIGKFRNHLKYVEANQA